MAALHIIPRIRNGDVGYFCRRAICLINMPLFMFIVGYFSKSSIMASFKDMLMKKWHTLIVPMLIFCLASAAIDAAAIPMAYIDLIGAGVNY